MKPCKYLIGITGGIASGKSTVSNIIKEEYPLIDADEIAKKVLNQGEKGYIKVVQYLGEEILSEDKNIDRVKLANIIFKKEKEKKYLNKILHPIIIEYMKDEIDKNEGIIFLDIPLLIENLDLLNKSHITLDEIWLVYVDLTTQIQRLEKRDNIDKDRAMLKIQAQIPLEEKKKFGTYIIDNTGSLEELEKKVKTKLLSL